MKHWPDSDRTLLLEIYDHNLIKNRLMFKRFRESAQKLFDNKEVDVELEFKLYTIGDLTIVDYPNRL